ncbi:MAG: hypothetical protein P8L23_00145, partial [Flavobacteriales bacterium]|nr:hypothetical protein [Flavobacteriales bacterium]
LVLLSRIGMITSIVLAVCYPYKKSNQVNTTNKTIGIYIDNSFSMDRNGQASTLLNQAKDDAYTIVDAHDENTNFFLMTNSKNFGSTNKLTKQQTIDLVSKIQPTKDLLNYNNVILRQTEQIKSNADLYWFTDLQKTNSFNKINIIDSLTKVNIISYEGLNNNNLSIDSIWFEDKNRKINQNEELNISVTNNAQENFDFKTVLNINKNELENQRVFNINAQENKIVKLNFKVKKHGLKSCKLKLEDYPSPDHLFDDEYYFTYRIKKEFKLLHAYNTKENSFSKINSLFGTVENTLLKSIDINDKLISNYSDYDILILDGIPQINNEINNVISTFLTAKKTVVLIPSINKLDIESFNKNLSYLNINIVAIDSNKQTLNQIDKKNKFFKDVFEATNSNLQLPFFKNHYNIKKSANHQTLLSFENGNPLFISKNYKQGDFYFFSGNISTSNSDLTEHSLFVPLFLRMFEEANSFQTLSYSTDENISIESNIENSDYEKINIIAENNPTINTVPSFNKFNGKSYYVINNNLLDAGNFIVLSENDTIDGFSLNYNRMESKMDFYSIDEINQEIFNANLENQIIIHDDNDNRISNLIRSKISGEFYWKYFIILALLFIILEITIIRLTNK